jgi:N-formylglutamate amidohydrolase
MERISIIEGKKPILFIAPHGRTGDDYNTSVIAEEAAKAINAYAVINRGWIKSNNYDYSREHADCNNTYHLQQDVIYDEFLMPIKRYINRIKKRYPAAYMITIHGCTNEVKKIANNPDLSMIVGYGIGTPISLTCQEWMKDLFCYQAAQFGWTVYEGGPGGPYSAWARQNLCQYYRKWEADLNVHAMQLEIVREWRSDKNKAAFTAECIADYVSEITNYSSWAKPYGFSVPLF